ncbi:MAG TPA: NAD-dependent epimerase/dehydratase family protein, partial [Pyrinomonadaceae bacterium]|nr:NAD-dependent epimerase/dehydratase family protein [Pyrinomonadaceae bacterium]
ERVCRHYTEDFGLDTRVVRFHNIFGPLGTYDGGREKSPAAICRKIALANDGDDIEVWGDGEQTRSYCYIDDCVEGIYRLMRSEHREPINLGQDRMISINELVDIVAKIAGKRIGKAYDLTKPQGVRGRNSDNTRLREVLKWEPKISLEEGLEQTYHWIAGELAKNNATVKTLVSI